MTDTTTLTNEAFGRLAYNSLLKRRFFFIALYVYRQAGFRGDTGGLFNYGAPSAF